MNAPHSGSRPTSPWLFVALGCVGAVAVIVFAVVGLGIYGARKIQEFGDSMADPEQRESQVLEVLGLDAIPPGYFPLIGMRVPYLVDVAILSDKVMDDGAGPSFDSRGFIYISYFQPDETERNKLIAFFRGESDDLAALREQGYQLDVRRRLGRGELDLGDQELMWVGTLARMDASEEDVSLATILLISCDEAERRQRMAVWFGPPPDWQAHGLEAPSEEGSGPDRAVEPGESVPARYEPALVGSVADPEQIQSFVGSMTLCR